MQNESREAQFEILATSELKKVERMFDEAVRDHEEFSLYREFLEIQKSYGYDFYIFFLNKLGQHNDKRIEQGKQRIDRYFAKEYEQAKSDIAGLTVSDRTHVAKKLLREHARCHSGFATLSHLCNTLKSNAPDLGELRE